jgi:hypothetical protein
LFFEKNVNIKRDKAKKFFLNVAGLLDAYNAERWDRELCRQLMCPAMLLGRTGVNRLPVQAI